MADESDRGLNLGVDESRNIDIGETHKEVKDHDEEHGPGEMPDIGPKAPHSQIDGLIFMERGIHLQGQI